MMNIYVGNLAYAMSREELADLFGQYGEVTRATIVTDRESGLSKGFGFVEMTDAAAGQEAMDALNNFEVKGRALRVNEARPREERPRTGGGDRPRRSFNNDRAPRREGGFGGRDRF